MEVVARLEPVGSLRRIRKGEQRREEGYHSRRRLSRRGWWRARGSAAAMASQFTTTPLHNSAIFGVSPRSSREPVAKRDKRPEPRSVSALTGHYPSRAFYGRRRGLFPKRLCCSRPQAPYAPSSLPKRRVNAALRRPSVSRYTPLIVYGYTSGSSI